MSDNASDETLNIKKVLKRALEMLLYHSLTTSMECMWCLPHLTRRISHCC